MTVHGVLALQVSSPAEVRLIGLLLSALATSVLPKVTLARSVWGGLTAAGLVCEPL